MPQRKVIASSAFVLGICVLIISIRFLPVGSASAQTAPATVNWLRYGNDLANTRFQNVDQINRSNVAS
jgi:hypothetical protein